MRDPGSDFEYTWYRITGVLPCQQNNYKYCSGELKRLWLLSNITGGSIESSFLSSSFSLICWIKENTTMKQAIWNGKNRSQLGQKFNVMKRNEKKNRDSR